MALTRRGRVFSALTIVIVVLGAVVFGIVAFGSRNKSPSASGTPGAGISTREPRPPPICPLSGLKGKGSVPNRPALAVKVENLPIARPQTGLDFADIIYEEPVEGGITRFIVIYQCQDAGRVEPVRSGRLVDPDILVQFGRPIFGYAGAISPAIALVARRSIIDVNYIRDPGAYHRDPSRVAPHNLYTSTRELYAVAHVHAGPPRAIFTYSRTIAEGASGKLIHIPFSFYSDVYWQWNGKRNLYLRSHGSVPAILTDGVQISASNVVVQFVDVFPSPYVEDPTGAHENIVKVVGRGRAIVYRNGRKIVGEWVRNSLSDTTQFLDRQGQVIPLSPGVTWIELVPSDKRVSSR